MSSFIPSSVRRGNNKLSSASIVRCSPVMRKGFLYRCSLNFSNAGLGLIMELVAPESISILRSRLGK